MGRVDLKGIKAQPFGIGRRAGIGGDGVGDRLVAHDLAPGHARRRQAGRTFHRRLRHPFGLKAGHGAHMPQLRTHFAAGGKMGPQLWHVGAVASFQTEWVPEAPVESPSGLAAPGVPRGEIMSDEAIADTIAAYARAAADAKRLGFDTLEIHAAHGYLIDQFFWSATNQRNDRFGGTTLKARSRFAAEVLQAMRA